MFQRFFPNEYYDSTYHIDFHAFYDKLKDMGYGVCFVSNNDEERVKSFNEQVGATYVYKAGKPSARGYVQAMQKLGTERTNTLFVGDQIFTDIWGANNAQLYSILVQPIAKHEEIQIVLKRIPEKWVLHSYLKKHTLQTGK